MGKETKIGLSVIGVLLSVFSVLLFRHFMSSHTPPTVGQQDQALVVPLSSSGMGKPAGEAGPLKSKLWDDAPAAMVEAAENVVEKVGEAVAAVEEVANPYAEEFSGGVAFDNAADADLPVAARAPGASPFSQAPAKVPRENQASELPADETVARAGRNPLRRVGAELPLEGPATAQHASAEMELPPADPYVDSVPDATRDPFETAPAAEPHATGPAYDFGQPAPAARASKPDWAQPGESAPQATQNSAPHDPFGTPQFNSAEAEPAAATPQAATSDPFGGPAASEPEFGNPQAMPSRGMPAQSLPVQPMASGGAEDAMNDVPTGDEAPGQVAPEPKADPFDRFESRPAPSRPPGDWQAAPDPNEPVSNAQPTPEYREPAFQSSAAPAVVTPAAEQPLPVENGLYTVQPGDTLWSISEKVYGTGGYFKALAAQNRAMLPRSDKLTVGTQIAVPPTSDLERDFPSLCPRQRKSALVRPETVSSEAVQRRANSNVYIVSEGDTLFDIARYELGKASRWAEIYELNRDILGEDFDYLRPGTELVMPARAETASRAAADRY